MSSPTEINEIIAAVRSGDHGAEERLIAATYSQLVALAERIMSRHGQTATDLQPTTLVHETWLQMLGKGTPLVDHAHVFALASSIMRLTLLNFSRTRAVE